MEKTTLHEPVFKKVAALTDCCDGYNVYVRVLSASHEVTRNGQYRFVKAVVGDETGTCNAFFRDETSNLIQVGQTLAIRNGLVRFFRRRICLEIDVYGRITYEPIKI